MRARAKATCYLLLVACGGGDVVRAPSSPDANDKERVVTTSPSPEFANPASTVALDDETSTVVVLREPPRPIDAARLSATLLERLRSGVPARIVDAFTEDFVLVGGAARVMPSGPAPHRLLDAMIRSYPGELEDLAVLRFREQRVTSRRSLTENASPFFSAAARSLPPPGQGELILVVTVDAPTRIFFPVRGRTLLLLREEQGVFRIRALVDDTTSAAP